MRIAELARRAGIAPSAVRFYEAAGALPPAARGPNGYRAYTEPDLAHLRVVVTLRRLGVAPVEAGRLARLCLERGAVDLDLAPYIAEQRLAIERQRADLQRLDTELGDLERTIGAAGRAAQEGSAMPDAPIRVLFVCTGNSARSQLAEALLQQHGGAAFHAFSAGTVPKGVNPYTVRVLAEVGIDWSKARSKSVDEFLEQHFDYVITVCDRARQACPVFPGEHNTLHWGLDDPAEVEGSDAQKLAAFQRTRREIMTRLHPFIELALRGRRTAPASPPGRDR
ncbi:MAG: arsenate reductase/protein-tyrosine-phosphatase family protein [Candidatus Limnocylindrales bacterium]